MTPAGSKSPVQRKAGPSEHGPRGVESAYADPKATRRAADAPGEVGDGVVLGPPKSRVEEEGGPRFSTVPSRPVPHPTVTPMAVPPTPDRLPSAIMRPEDFDVAHIHARAGEHGVTSIEHALAALGLAESAMGVQAALGGSEAPVHRVTTADGRLLALRVRPPEHAEAIKREAANVQLAASLGVAPRVLGVYCGPEVACLLTEWVPGQPLADLLAVEPERLLEWGWAMGRFLASMHQAANGHARLGTLDAGWARPHSEEEARRLKGLPPCDVPTLVHLDFHPLNVMVSGGAVTAAVDWMNAGAGDARLDVARTAACMALDGPLYDASWERWIPTLLAAFADGYQTSLETLREMAPFMCWAGEATLRDLRPKRTPEQVAQMQATARRWEHSPCWPPSRAMFGP